MRRNKPTSQMPISKREIRQISTAEIQRKKAKKDNILPKINSNKFKFKFQINSNLNSK